MVSFLKKLFGGKEQVLSDPVEQASAAAVSTAKSAAAPVQAQVASADAKVENLQNLASSVMGGGMPDIDELQGAISELPEGELSSVVSGALDSVPADARTQLGGLLAQLPSAGDASAGIAAGDSAALGVVLSSLLKGEGGLGSLAGLFGGAAGGGGGGFGDVVSGLNGGTGGGLDIAGLMSNPLAKTILAALVPAIMKAVQGK